MSREAATSPVVSAAARDGLRPVEGTAGIDRFLAFATERAMLIRARAGPRRASADASAQDVTEHLALAVVVPAVCRWRTSAVLSCTWKCVGRPLRRDRRRKQSSPGLATLPTAWERMLAVLRLLRA